MDNIDNRKHNVILTERSRALISGVSDINEFDNNSIDLITTNGKMIIKGKELKVKGINIEKGEAEIEGKIDNISYSSKVLDESVIKRLFK